MTSDEYQQAARELARRTAMPDDAAARVEAALERAVESTAREEEPPSRARYIAWAAAAALVIAAGAWYASRQAVTLNNVMAKGDASGSVRLQADSVTKDEVHLKVDTTGSVRLQADATRTRPKRLPPVIRPAGFVPVPAAARLPEFESGVIVRMALPAAALPSYGVDISPAWSDRPIEADVLLGQDGLARAIRLVNTSRSQQ